MTAQELHDLIQRLSEFPLDDMTQEGKALVFQCFGAVESYEGVYAFSSVDYDHLGVDEKDSINPFWIKLTDDHPYAGSWQRSWQGLLEWYRHRSKL